MSPRPVNGLDFSLSASHTKASRNKNPTNSQTKIQMNIRWLNIQSEIFKVNGSL